MKSESTKEQPSQSAEADGLAFEQSQVLCDQDDQCSKPDSMANNATIKTITPESFRRLSPVHYIIFDILCAISPAKAARINKQMYNKIVPSFYESFTLNRQSLSSVTTILGRAYESLLPVVQKTQSSAVLVYEEPSSTSSRSAMPPHSELQHAPPYSRSTSHDLSTAAAFEAAYHKVADFGHTTELTLEDWWATDVFARGLVHLRRARFEHVTGRPLFPSLKTLNIRWSVIEADVRKGYGGRILEMLPMVYSPEESSAIDKSFLFETMAQSKAPVCGIGDLADGLCDGSCRVGCPLACHLISTFLWPEQLNVEILPSPLNFWPRVDQLEDYVPELVRCFMGQEMRDEYDTDDSVNYYVHVPEGDREQLRIPACMGGSTNIYFVMSPDSSAATESVKGNNFYISSTRSREPFTRSM
ncbi:hypothetical protein IAU59_005454 [Kwoniella sp. CBS 9459]